MRILWIKTELLHPVDKGGRIRTYQMLRALRREHHVTYLCLDDGTAAPNAITLAIEYAHDVVTAPFKPASKMSVGFFVELLVNVFSPLPYAVARYRSVSLRREIVRLAPLSDVVICDFLAPAINVPNELTTPTLLFQHNVEAQIWERHASVPQNALRRAYMKQQWRRMRNFEASECRRFGHVVAVSEQDAQTMRSDYGAKSVSHVGTGVDTEYFSPQGVRPFDNHEIVFVGSMDWMPNDDAMRWLLADILPRIRVIEPQAKLTIVGRNPSAALRQLASQVKNVEVTGTVDDVRPYLARAAVCVVPLRVGGGTRLKIYEAMAMGAPMVSTTIGAEGLPVRDSEHLLIADSPEAQAAAIGRLLRDRSVGAMLAENALRYVRAYCGWRVIAEQFLAGSAPSDSEARY